LAQALAQHKGDLHLWGLESLSDAAAQALAQCKGDLYLRGRCKRLITAAKRKLNEKKLDAGSKKPLAKVKKLITANNADSFALAVELVRTLELDNEATWLKLLSKSRVVQLVKLQDNRVTNLLLEIAVTSNPFSAQALAQHKGDLDLRGLTSLSETAAQALAQHKGDLGVPPKGWTGRVQQTKKDTLPCRKPIPPTTKSSAAMPWNSCYKAIAPSNGLPTNWVSPPTPCETGVIASSARGA
jgi:hypothetical protein